MASPQPVLKDPSEIVREYQEACDSSTTDHIPVLLQFGVKPAPNTKWPIAIGAALLIAAAWLFVTMR